MSANAPRLEELFEQALAIPPGENREKFLTEACGSDADLRQRLDRLLRASQEAGSFMEIGQANASPTLDQPPLEQPGTQIGPYKLLQEIGEGGMGVVYMAEQHAPVKRRVALKLVKPGMDSRQVVARFEAERQALALMDHPNIARVLDCGTTEQGRPYFVMELVKGVPITKYCDENHLTPRERLQLFIPICQAIQHAHQKGIIHRDIKPSNILVAEYDQKPVPKIIDFGVAKALNAQLTDLTMFTQLGQVVGTLEYMSPEQSRVNQLDVDTRSDIYSLGVLLYELLTGATPFDRKRFRAAAFDEMLRIIREEEPPRPSTRLSTIDTLPSIAANRKTEPKKLGSMLRGELDWIVMKALEKDRARRYETATGFANDIQRYLSDEPVAACPPSMSYRLSKLARRNKAILTTVGFVALAMLVGTGVSVWQAIRATRAEGRAVTLLAEAVAARHEAETQRGVLATTVDQAIQALDEVYLQVAENQQLEAGVLDEKSKQFLKKALPFYESFTQHKGDDPQTRLALARATLRVGSIQRQLRQFTPAEAILRKAVERWDALLAEQPGNSDYRYGQAFARWELVMGLRECGQPAAAAEAETLYPELARLFEALARDYPDKPIFGQFQAQSQRDLGLLLEGLNRREEAERQYRKAIALFDVRLKEYPANAPLKYQAALTAQWLATLLRGAGRMGEAVTEFTQSQETFRDLKASTGLEEAVRAHGTWQLATLLRDSARTSEAIHYLEQAVERFRELIKLNPADPDLRLNFVHASRDLALVYRDQPDLPRALKPIQEAQAMAQALASFWPENQTYRYALLNAEYELATVLERLSRLDEAQQHIDRAVEHLESLKTDSPSLVWRHDSFWTHVKASEIARRQSRFEEYEHLLRLAIADREPALSESAAVWWDFQQYVYAAKLLAAFLQSENREDEALLLARKAFEAAQAGWQRFSDQMPAHDMRESARRLGSLLVKSNRTELDRLCERDLDPHTRIGLAKVLYRAGSTDRAANLFDKAMAQLRSQAATIEGHESPWKMLTAMSAHAYFLWGNAWSTDGWPEANRALRQEIEQLLADWLRENPDDARLRNVAGHIYHQRGDELKKAGRITEAIEAYDKALENHPKHYWAMLNRGEAYRALGNKRAALNDYLATREIPCDDSFFILHRADRFANLGEYAEALKDYDRLIEMSPTQAAGHAGRGNALIKLGRIEEGQASLRRAVELEPNNERARIAAIAARALIGQVEEAEEELQNLLGESASPDRVLLLYGKGVYKSPPLMERAVEISAAYGTGVESLMHFNMACGLALNGQKDQAFNALKRSIELGGVPASQYSKDFELSSLREDPRFAELMAKLPWIESFAAGRQKYEAGKFLEAIYDLDRAIELNPNCPVLYEWRGSAYRNSGQTAEATADFDRYLEFYQQVADAEPENWVAWQRLAEAHATLQRWDEALQAVTKATELAPEQPTLRRIRADIQLALKHWGDAETELTRLLEKSPADWQLHYHRALARLAQDDRAGYRAACAEMLTALSGTQDPVAANFAAWTCCLAPAAVDDWTVPLKLARQATTAQPDSQQNQNTLGFVLLRAGKLDEAILTLDAAAAKSASGSAAALISPIYTWFGLALAHQVAGHADQAKSWYARAAAEAEKQLGEPASNAAPLAWNRRLTLELLQREAQAALGPKPPESPADTTPNE